MNRIVFFRYQKGVLVHLYIDTIFFDKGTAAGEKRLIKGTSKEFF